MNFSKPVAIVLLVFVIGFVVFPQSSADFVTEARTAIVEFSGNLGT